MLDTTLANENSKIDEPRDGKPDHSLIGFSDAAKVKGSTIAYGICLEKFYSTIVLDHTKKSDIIKKENQKILDEINQLQEKIKLRTNELKELQDKIIPNAKNEIQKANDDYLDFKQNPSKYVDTHKDKFSLWLYGFLSVVIGLFLFFFYSSVIYSAFFREIKIDKMTLLNSIFYPKAIEEAWALGFTAAMIVILGPMIFLALGIIIDRLKHKSTDRKFNLSYILVLIFTFALDALLAYHISERIYESKAVNVYDNIQPFSIIHALKNLDFWIIIAMGFCVYILFGKVFSIFDEQRSFKNEFEKVENTFRSRIKIAENKLIELQSRVNQLKSEIKENEDKIAELKSSPEIVVFNPLELKNILSDYTIGWISFLTYSGRKDEKIEEVKRELELFYNLKGLIKDEKN